jgi:PAP2 superfamily
LPPMAVVGGPPLTLAPAEGRRDEPTTTKNDGLPERQGRDRSAKRSPLLVELAVIAFLGWIYDWLQDLAPVRLGLALRNGQAILSFEERLHISPEKYLDHWLAHHYWLAYISSDFYDNAIFVFTACLAIWLWWRRPDIYRPLRNDLVLANLIGFAVFWLFPVAPPRMLPGFIDVVEKVGGLGSWHNTLISHADQLAAMPSMHLAWAVWCSIVLWRLAGKSTWRWGALAVGVAYPLATALVVLGTANHYLTDVLAGAACTAVSLVIVELAWPRALRVYRRLGTSKAAGDYQRSST